MKNRSFPILILFAVATFFLCLCLGSVYVPVSEIIEIVFDYIKGREPNNSSAASIIMLVRLPRVICVGLVGASLSLCGAVMQGLLRNPLADGSTLGVSAGASLGAVLAIAFGVNLPIIGGGTTGLAIFFAFLSLALILFISSRLDYSMSTSTIILTGVIFSMFANSLISMITVFAGEKVKSIVFWTMGSLAGTNFKDAILLLVSLILCGMVMIYHAEELNAFSIGETNAKNIGIDVKRVKIIIMVAVSVLIGISVSIGGTIGFVGLVIPHITRMLTGPNHKKLLPASLFSGAIFLNLADLIGRVILRPLELPIGSVTSIIGAIVFIYVFYTTRKVR